MTKPISDPIEIALLIGCHQCGRRLANDDNSIACQAAVFSRIECGEPVAYYACCEHCLRQNLERKLSERAVT